MPNLMLFQQVYKFFIEIDAQVIENRSEKLNLLKTYHKSVHLKKEFKLLIIGKTNSKFM